MLDIVLALGGALGLGLVLARFGQSPIVGYLIAGVIIGPGALGILSEPEQVEALAEIGVALLLFTIGLEFSWHRLRALGPVAAAGGLAQILLTAALGAAIAGLLGARPAAAATLGMILALSSTAVVFRVLAERAEIDSVPGRVVVGILLLQDIAVIPLVLIVPLLGGGAGAGGPDIASEIGLTLARGAILILGMIALARFGLPGLFNAAALNSRELFIILGLTFCLGATWAADAWGLSPVLGAFIAGVLLADTRYAGQIRADIGPLRAGFVALFFVSIGMLADAGWIARNGLLVAALVAAIVLGKTLITAIVVRLFRYTVATALLAGLSLAHIGELSFVLAGLGRFHGLLDDEMFQLIVSASVGSLLLTPYLIGGGRRLVRALPWRGAVAARAAEAAAEDEVEPERQGHVIVVGFGPTGARVVSALADVGTPFVVIETNPQTVRSARARGLDAMFGDATHEEILRGAGIGSAIALVVTVPDPPTAATIVNAARSLHPRLPIVARARYSQYLSLLAESGADVLANEEELMGERLASVTLKLVGLASEALARLEYEPEEERPLVPTPSDE